MRRRYLFFLSFLLIQFVNAQENKFGYEPSAYMMIEGYSPKKPAIGFGIDNRFEFKTRKIFSFVARLSTDFFFLENSRLPNGFYSEAFSRVTKGVAQHILFPFDLRFSYGKKKTKFFFEMGFNPFLVMVYGKIHVVEWTPHYNPQGTPEYDKKILCSGGAGFRLALGIRYPVSKSLELVVSTGAEFSSTDVVFANPAAAIWKLNVGFNYHFKPVFGPKKIRQPRVRVD